MRPTPKLLCSAGPEILVPKGGVASTRRHSNNSIEPEVEIVTQTLWAPQASETTE